MPISTRVPFALRSGDPKPEGKRMRVRFPLGWGAAVLVALAAASSAQERPTLTVYTYASFAGEYGPGETVRARFEAECSCVLEWVTTEDAGTLIARLLLEGRSTRADVVLGLDANLVAATDVRLFAPHGLALPPLDLPTAWTDDIFVPFDWGWFAFVYDAEKLPNPPQSLAELVADPNGPTILIQDPRTSSPGLGLLLWVKEVFGAEAGAAWSRLAPRIVTVTRGWSEAYGLFLAGEADMVLSYTTSPAYHVAVENETRYRAAVFAEGHGLQIEVAAIVAGTHQPDLARSFLAFMVGDAFQSAIPEGNWMYPARVPTAGLPSVLADLPRPPASLLVPPETIEANRRAWIDEWLAALTR